LAQYFEKQVTVLIFEEKKCDMSEFFQVKEAEVLIISNKDR